MMVLDLPTIVLGASGALGSRLVARLAAQPGVRLTIPGGRGPSGEVAVPWPDGSVASWRALTDQARLVVACTPPGPWLANLVEASMQSRCHWLDSFPVLHPELEASYRRLRAEQTGCTLLTQGGAFPGLASALGLRLCSQVPDPRSLDVGITLSQWSSAGSASALAGLVAIITRKGLVLDHGQWRGATLCDWGSDRLASSRFLRRACPVTMEELRSAAARLPIEKGGCHVCVDSLVPALRLSAIRFMGRSRRGARWLLPRSLPPRTPAHDGVRIWARVVGSSGAVATLEATGSTLVDMAAQVLASQAIRLLTRDPSPGVWFAGHRLDLDAIGLDLKSSSIA